MRDYATVAPQFWLGKTGRELRKKGAEAQVVSFYLMTSPHANMLGLYYLPILYIAHETGLGLEGASKGLRSQDQEQDQEQEQDKDLSGHGSATPSDGGSSDEAPSEKPKSSYPEEFELAWREYPKRAGGNSKVDAFKAWTARIKSGATAQELTDGVRRYADYVTAAGKLNTEYVKQASTFFGPSKHYEELWSFEVPTGKRDPNSISQPDKLIPSGFRG